MTREEAIDVLKHNYPSTCFTDLCEAVDIAIQALSAQPEVLACGSGELVQESDSLVKDLVKDCISRKMAIETVSNMFAVTATQKDMVEDCLEILENLPSLKFATDINVGDTIYRQDAIDAMNRLPKWSDDLFSAVCLDYSDVISVLSDTEKLPSAQPEIIYCKDCVKHNKGHGYYCDGMSIGIKDCCPLVEIRGRAQGHEFDYQFCAYAERRQDV